MKFKIRVYIVREKTSLRSKMICVIIGIIRFPGKTFERFQDSIYRNQHRDKSICSYCIQVFSDYCASPTDTWRKRDRGRDTHRMCRFQVRVTWHSLCSAFLLFRSNPTIAVQLQYLERCTRECAGRSSASRESSFSREERLSHGGRGFH